MNVRRLCSRVILVALVTSAALSVPETSLSAPSSTGEVRIFTGRAAPDTFVAVTVASDRIRAYLCDGVDTGIWFSGEADEDGAFDLVATDGESRLAGWIEPGAVRGIAAWDGRERPFAAQKANSPAGLYRWEGEMDGEAVVGGWIVLNSGKQRGTFTLGTRTFFGDLLLVSGATKIKSTTTQTTLVNPSVVDSAAFIAPSLPSQSGFVLDGRAPFDSSTGHYKAWFRNTGFAPGIRVPPLVLMIDAQASALSGFMIRSSGGQILTETVQLGGSLATIETVKSTTKNATAGQVLRLLDFDEDGDLDGFDDSYSWLYLLEDWNASGKFDAGDPLLRPVSTQLARIILPNFPIVVDSYGNSVQTGGLAVTNPNPMFSYGPEGGYVFITADLRSYLGSTGN